MSDSKDKPAKSSGPGLVGLLLPAVIAGGAAFGGARLAGGAHHEAPAASAEHAEAKPPGPTLALEPFLVTVPDAAKKAHPMKVTIAVEFVSTGKEEANLKELAPRIRDAALGYFRTLTYEDVLDPAVTDKMRGDLLERLKGVGSGAARVLVTDLVVQ